MLTSGADVDDFVADLERPELERDVDDDRLGNRHFDVAPNVRREAGELRPHLVLAGRQAGEDVPAFRASHGRA